MKNTFKNLKNNVISFLYWIGYSILSYIAIWAIVLLVAAVVGLFLSFAMLNMTYFTNVFFGPIIHYKWTHGIDFALSLIIGLFISLNKKK